MAPEVLLYGSSNELPSLQEFSKTEPVDIRGLNPELEQDVAIAREWDREATGEEGALEKGAIHPFESTSRNLMSEEELRRWIRGDERHVLRGIFDKEQDVGFVYAYDDLDGRKRLRYLQSRGLVPQNAMQREINWWTDRATTEQAKSGIAQTLLDLFSQHKSQRPLAILLYIEKDDLDIDGKLAKKLGFKEIAKGINYDMPGKADEDTAFLLTKESFAKALAKR